MNFKAKLILVVCSIVTVVTIRAANAMECGDVQLPHTIKDTSAPSIECIGTFHDLMKLAWFHGQRIDFPETIQAILLQETQGGRIRTDARQEQFEWAAYGVMQIQPETARYIMECILKHPDEDVPEDDIIIKLMLKSNDNFSIQLAVTYFKYLYDVYVEQGNHPGVAWRMALLAYNIGPGKLKEQGMGYDPNMYLDGIRKNLEIVRAYNKAYNLGKITPRQGL